MGYPAALTYTGSYTLVAFVKGFTLRISLNIRRLWRWICEGGVCRICWRCWIGAIGHGIGTKGWVLSIVTVGIMRHFVFFSRGDVQNLSCAIG